MRVPLLALRAAPAILLALASASCSSSPTTSMNTPPPPMTNDVDIVMGASTLTNTAFSPDTKNVSLAGGASVAVRFVNNDVDPNNYGATGVTHHIVSDDGTTFDAGTVTAYHTMTIALTAAGTIPFHCAIHPNMVGSIVVSP
jgi:plastocyanin